MTKWETEKFIEPRTRALLISFTLYNPSSGAWVTSRILFEFSVFGMVMAHPSVFDAVSFKPNIFEISNGGFYFFLELLRFAFLIYVFVCLIVLKIIGKKGINRACRAQTFITLIADFALIGLCIYNFVLLLLISTKTKSNILKTETFYNMVSKAERYNNLAVIEAIIIAILLRKIISVF